MSTDWILYHANCYDGFGAAWSAKQNPDFANSQFVAMNYHDPLPDIKPGDSVYMVDYSRKRSEIEALVQACQVTILDHHKSAIENLEGLYHPNLTMVLDTKRSGAMITWNYFNPDRLPPALIQHIQDRDLWLFDLVDTKAVHAGLCAHPFSFNLWDAFAFLQDDFKNLIDLGYQVLAYHDVLIDRFCEEAVWMELGGFTVPVANICMLFSEVPERLLKMYPDAQFAGYHYTVKGGVRRFGLRSRKTDDVDVSKIAATYGGGGHKNAAGFELQETGIKILE